MVKVPEVILLADRFGIAVLVRPLTVPSNSTVSLKVVRALVPPLLPVMVIASTDDLFPVVPA